MANKSQITNSLLRNILIICLGSLQFGYHMGELNAASQYITCDYLDFENKPNGDGQCILMTSQQFALVTSIFSIGGLAGSFVSGKLADKKGRKVVCLYNSIGFVIGSLVVYFSKNISSFIVGRIILGLASGSSIVLTSLMISEIAPLEIKDSLGTFNQAFINIGILLVQTLSLKWAKPLIWRDLFVFSTIIALCQMALISFMLEETPRWLFNNGNESKARIILAKFRDNSLSHNELTQELYQKQTSNTELEEQNLSSTQLGDVEQQKVTITGWKEYLTAKKYRTSMIFVTIILVGQQLCGINSIILYSAQVITDLSGKNGDSLAKQVNFVISIVNAIFTFVSPKTISIIGRNLSLSLSALFMGICSLVIALSLQFSHLNVLIIFLIFFIIAFALGVGPIPFLIISDLTPLEARSVSQSFGTVNNWLGTFLVSYTFPILADIFGMPIVFSLFSFFAIGFAAIIYFKLPTVSHVDNHHNDDVEHERLL